MTHTWEVPDPITFLEGLLPGNVFAGEPPLPRAVIDAMRPSEEDTPAVDHQIEKPGCTAAESTILTLGFLEGLADGLGGFGVLRQGKEYLEKGARAAQALGRNDVAQELRDIAAELPNVRDPEQARIMSARLRPLKEATWEMGRKCKGSLSPEAVHQARALAEQIRLGEISFERAVRQMRGGSNA